MKVTVIPIVIGALGKIPTWLVKGSRRLGKKKVEWRPSKLQHYYDRLEYWEEFWTLKESCCDSNSIEKPSANDGEKNSQKSQMKILKVKKKTLKKCLQPTDSCRNQKIKEIRQNMVSRTLKKCMYWVHNFVFALTIWKLCLFFLQYSVVVCKFTVLKIYCLKKDINVGDLA